MSKYVNAAAVAAVALASGANAENQWFQKGTLFASKWYETCDEILEVAGKEANQANKARCMGQPEEMLEEVMDYRTFCCAGAKTYSGFTVEAREGTKLRNRHSFLVNPFYIPF